MAVNAFAIVGAGSLGTAISQLMPNSVLIGRCEEPPLYKGRSIKNFTRKPEIMRNSYTVLFCVKAYDQYQTLLEYRRYLNKNQNIILISNGFYQRYFAKRLLGDLPNVWAGFTTMAAHKTGNSVKLIDKGKFYLAPLSDYPQLLPRFTNLIIFLCDYSLMSWQKGIANSLINPLATLFEVKNGDLVQNQPLYNIFGDLYNEICSLKFLKRYPDRDELEGMLWGTADNYCSTLQDFKSGKPCELPYITGYLLKQVRKNNCSLPLLSAIYDLVLEKFKNRKKDN
ncbi:MAG: ketopantoate reductase C-terminal domain-containing protein [Candidatus Wallbacteria bacterium]|nr:ketopantoate reductase C-terminal domain-containing protein [Candidatus Wallbacteria bacterium]